MGEISKALGLAETITHKGKEYKLAPFNFEVMGLWEQYLERRAFDALDRQKSRYNPAQFAQKEQELIERIAAGKYSFFSQASAAAQQDALGPGQKHLLLIRLQALEPDIDEALVDEIIEEQADKLLRLLRKENAADPNAPAPPAAGREFA